jgi:hypothetical protein
MMNIKTHIATQIKAIGAILQREQLACRLVATIQGPLTLTYRMRLVDPTRQNMTHILAMSGVLQSILLVESVRIQQVNGLIEIQIPSPMPLTPTATAMREASNGLNVAIGWDSMGKPLQIDFAQHGAVFWVGPSRRGKTQSMRSTLYATSKAVQGALRYCIVCQHSKRHDWDVFDKSKHSMGVVTDFAEIEQAVKWFSQRTQIGRGKHEYILLIDDLPSILQVCKIAKDLATIASVGAGVGVHLLAGTQAAGSKAGSGGELIEANITARVVYKPASKATAARNAGQGGMDLDQLSSAKGDAVLLVDGYPERIATALATDAEIATLPQGRIAATWRPWEGGYKVVTEAVQGGYDNRLQVVTAPVTGGYTRVNSVPDAVTGYGGYGNQLEAFKLPTNREPTPAEYLTIYQVYIHTGSRNATMKQIWGGKNGKYAEWIREAIDRNGAPPVDNKIIRMNERRHA